MTAHDWQQHETIRVIGVPWRDFVSMIPGWEGSGIRRLENRVPSIFAHCQHIQYGIQWNSRKTTKSSENIVNWNPVVIFFVAWLWVESWLHQNNASSETLEKRSECRAQLHSSIRYTEANPAQYKNQHFSGSFGNLMAPKETTDQPTVAPVPFCIDKYKSRKRHPFHSKFWNTDWHLYLQFFTMPSLQTWLNSMHNSTAQTSEGTSPTKLL